MMLAVLSAWVALLGAVLQAQEPAVAEKARRAGELVQSGKAAEAVPIYKELTAAYPGEPAFAMNLAIAQYKAGRYRDSIEQCDAVLQRRPDLFAAWLFLGASHYELSEPAAAVEPLRRALSLRPDDRNARVMLAGALLDIGQAAGAAAEFEKVAQAMPQNPRAQYGLSKSYEALAKDAFLRLEKTAPGSAEWLALGGDFELERGGYARAFQRYRQALAVRPQFPGLHAAVAAIYEKTEHPDWAAVERARETGPSPDCRANPPACATLAERLYWESKKYTELSRAACARLRELPPSPELYEAEASTGEMAGRYPEAAAAWRQALAFSPGNLRIQHRLALALCRANDCGSALPIIGELLAHDPASAELNFLYGTALKTAEQPARALAYLEKAVKLDGSRLGARADLGEAYLDAGKPDLAIPQLEAAVAEDPDGTRHYQLARAYQAAGRRERADAVLRDYREIRRQQDDEPRITPP